MNHIRETRNAAREGPSVRGRLLGVLALLMASMAWGRVPVPQYNLPVGKKLIYTTQSSTLYGKARSGTAVRLELWITALNPDSSRRVILNRALSSYRQGPDGKGTESQPAIDWAWCDIFPDGHIPANSSLGDMDPMTIFIPLPGDTILARRGWQHSDADREEVERFRLDNQSLDDSLWIIEISRQTPFDEVYEITYRGELRVDMERGLPLRRDAENLQGFGARASRSNTILDSIVPLDAAQLPALIREVGVFLRAESTASDLARAAGEESLGSARRFEQAESTLRLAQAQVTDSGLLNTLNREIGEYAGYAAQAAQAPHGSKPKLATGQKAPDWRLNDLDGKPHRLNDYRGKVLVLDFWYRGCPWCIRAMPQMNLVAGHYQGQPVQILGMNVDKDSADARFVVNKLKLAYPSLKAAGVPERYGVTGYPTMFVIGPDGTVRDIEIGYSKDMGEKLIRTIDGLLARK